MSWIVERSISELQELMSSGIRTAAQIVDVYLARISALDPALRSIVEVNPDARSIAELLDDERRSGTKRGPLHGIPILLKENIDTADAMLTSAGSLAMVTSMPLEDSTTAARLRAARVQGPVWPHLQTWRRPQSAPRPMARSCRPQQRTASLG